MPKPTLLILAASARAAAFSALRQQLPVTAADLFADADLVSRCWVTAVADYPQGLLARAAAAPPGSWLYAGGLENSPTLVDQVAALRPLAGNAGKVLRLVRDPWLVSQLLTQHNLPCPQLLPRGVAPQMVSPQEEASDAQRRWLAKSLRSTGGHGVTWGPAHRSVAAKEIYFQEYIPGRSLSGIFLANGKDCRLWGVTEQLIGTPWLFAKPFYYSGSLGSWSPTQDELSVWSQLGRVLTERFGLRGIFGIDAVLGGTTLWPVEINPRYTASVEVLEQATGLSAVSSHLAACDGETLPRPSPATPRKAVGKAILYAPGDLTVPAEISWKWLEQAGWPWPTMADIPSPTSRIPRGRPIVSVLAEVPWSERATLIDVLRQKASLCYDHLAIHREHG